jgi:hypothetical protein
MSNYPDNFATARAASFFGTDADDRRADRAAEIVEADMANAIKLQAAAAAFLAAIEGLEFVTRNPAGWDMDEVQGMARDCWIFDLATYRRKLERNAPDFARI